MYDNRAPKIATSSAYRYRIKRIFKAEGKANNVILEHGALMNRA